VSLQHAFRGKDTEGTSLYAWQVAVLAGQYQRLNEQQNMQSAEVALALYRQAVFPRKFLKAIASYGLKSTLKQSC